MISVNIVICAAFSIMKGAYNMGFLVSDLNFLRGLMGLLFVTPIMYYKGFKFIDSVPRGRRKSLLFRAFLSSIMIYSLNLSFKYLPLTEVIIIRNMIPFTVSIVGYFLNGEKPSKQEIIGMLVCFFGIILFTMSH